MRKLRMSIVPMLVVLTAFPSFAAAEQRHAVAPSALAAAVAGHAAKQDADRESIRQALSRPEVMDIAARTGVDVARVQKAEMRGIDLALERLQIVAITLDEADVDLGLRHVENFKARQRWRFGLAAHVDPNHAGALDHLISSSLDLLLEARRGQARHINAIAGNVEFPTVIDAAQPALFIASQEQRGATVRAAMVHDAHPARAVAKGNELFPEQHQANGRTVAHELGPFGITVNAIAPGYVKTELLAGVSEDVMKSIVGQIPVGRLGEADEVARCVVFLASDEAAWITGSTLTINGGQFMD